MVQASLLTLHMRIWRMSLYLYRYMPVSWPTWAKVYCRPSANWKASTLPSLQQKGASAEGSRSAAIVRLHDKQHHSR